MSRATKITTALAVILFLFQIIFGWQIADSLAVHEYVQGRDQAITSYERYFPSDGGSFGQSASPDATVTIVQSWYNPEHELHQLVDDTHVNWRDLNGNWHYNVYVLHDGNISLIFCAFYIIVLVWVYKRLKQKEKPLTEEEIQKQQWIRYHTTRD